MDILPSKLKQHFVGRFFQLNQNAIKMKVHRCEYAITTQYKRHDRGFKNGYHRLDDSFAKMTILVKRWLFLSLIDVLTNVWTKIEKSSFIHFLSM